MSSRATTTAAMSRSSQSQTQTQRRHRSRSTSRYADLEKPKKKKTLSATTSLVSIPNTIKLSMLNSGLLSFERVKLEARDANNSLSQTIPDKPIELRHFVKLCEQRRKFPVLYKLEFQTAVKVETNSCRHATRKNNVEKNQNQKCIPYDYNRVVLDKFGSLADSDYVNGSYVDSLLKPNAYIVTQGPTEETVLDFWRMVWQENVSAIIMLTKTFDFTKVMCVQYWPASKDKDETYGDLHIGIAKEEQLANFQIRTFRLYKKNGDKIIEDRHILQFHYTEWHSHTCPFSNAILEFRRRVRAVVGNIIKANSMVGPMLVHCNDGGGRSGVYLAIDANLELAEEEDCFHVFGYLKKLRQSRRGLIENVDQYKFVYDTLEEHIVCGDSWFPVKELSSRLKAKSSKDPVTKMNDYQKEYAQICKQTPRFTIGDCAGGHRADNRDKNRDVLCVPPDNFRPYLTSFQGNAFTDYINAVFVDGYTKPREYIVTEWPLKQVVGEFWSLVYDHECSAVVILCQPPVNSQSYVSFWPESRHPKKYGPVFTIEHISHHHYTNIKTWIFRINKKIVSLTELMAGVKAPPKTVQLFQLTCWPMGHKVPTSTNSLVELMNMVERWRQKTDYGPVCVVSPDGRSRSGVYCAANACIEQVIQHGEVDIFQAVKTVRRHRPQLVENMTEYKYCYDLVLHYVLHYLNKDLKEKKFIDFGRGKSIPLTPEYSNSDLPNETSNAGRIVVNKCIAKIEKEEIITVFEKNCSTKSQHHQLQHQFSTLTNEARAVRIIERKKKGRLYSLGGNDPPKKGTRGRLDRLKTVGTFDLGTEMSVLSEVAKNLNEKIIKRQMTTTTDIDLLSVNNQINENARRLSIVTSISASKSILNTPNSVHCDVSKSTGSFVAATDDDGEEKTFKTNLILEYFDNDNDYDNDNDNNRRSTSVPVIKNQHSADDSPRTRQLSASQTTPTIDSNNKGITTATPTTTGKKLRSLSTNSYLAKDNKVKAASGINGDITDDNMIEMKEISSNNRPTIIIQQRNKSIFTPVEFEDTIFIEKPKINVTIENDSFKIKEDIHSSEDINKKFDIKNDFANKPRKPMLRKSKRIQRTDSELLIDSQLIKSSEHIIVTGDKRPESYSSSIDDSRKTSSDFDDVCSPKDILFKSTDESSKNPSTDELDTVFSDTTDLEQLEKEYREYTKTNLQREYKSDGDTLDEIGRKRNEFGKWKNQSFDNDLDFYDDSNNRKLTIETNNNESIIIDNNLIIEKIIRPSNLDIVDKPIKYINNNNNSGNNSGNINSGNNNNNNSVNTISSLFEKRFNKFKKMNKLLRTKRFSTSALYDKKKNQIILNNMSSTAPPSSAQSDVSDKVSKTKLSSGKISLFGSKTSIYSSKTSLFSSKSRPTVINSGTGTGTGTGNGNTTTSVGFIFPGRKASGMFSHSNTELNSRTSSCSKFSCISKSSSEINRCKMSPSRYSSSTKPNSSDSKNSSGGVNGGSNSPLSEEFYNKTGSVRLSAVELFEKFCSEDFGGLYKHEEHMNDDRHLFDINHLATMSPYAKKHYFQNSKHLGTIRKYNTQRNSRLLKQKSEPKFSFRTDFGYDNVKPEEIYYHEEEDEDMYVDDDNVNGGEHGQYYEDEYEGDEYYEDEEEGEEEDDLEEDDEDDDEDIVVDVDEQGLRVVSNEAAYYKNSKNLLAQSVQDTCAEMAISTDSEVDEIFLMPAEVNVTRKSLSNINLDEYGFENKQFSIFNKMRTKSETHFTPSAKTVVDDDPLTKFINYDNTKVKYYNKRTNYNRNGDEVLTIYRIYSKDDILQEDASMHPAGFNDESNMKRASHADLLSGMFDAPMTATDAINSNEDDKKLDTACSMYIRNSLSDDLTGKDSLPITKCESIELLSNSSDNKQSGSTITDYAFDTVKNVNMDSCSTSKLSLSIKSEIFDDFTLTPEEQKVIIANNCDIEDFTLTPEEGSISDGFLEKTAATTTTASSTKKKTLVNYEMFNAKQGDSKESLKLKRTKSVTDPVKSANKLTRLSRNSIDVIERRKTFARQSDVSMDGDTGVSYDDCDGIGDVDVDADTNNDVLMVITRFIDNERDNNNKKLMKKLRTGNLLSKKETNVFNFGNIGPCPSVNDGNNDDGNLQLTIIDLDDDDDAKITTDNNITDNNIINDDAISEFTTELTKEFDLLFTRAEIDNIDRNTIVNNNNNNNVKKLPTRYSMQKLEPFNFDLVDGVQSATINAITSTSDIEIVGNTMGMVTPASTTTTVTATTPIPSTIINNSDKRTLRTRLKKNRSQSLGNLNKKTRCFPL